MLDTGKLHGSWKSHVKLFPRENSKSFHTLYIKFLSRVLQNFVESDEEREEKDPDWAPTPRPKRKKKEKEGKGHLSGAGTSKTESQGTYAKAFVIHARQLEVDRFPFDASADDAIRSTMVDTASVAHELLLCSQTIKLPQHFAVFRSVSERHCETKLICELQTTSNCKRIETLAVFPDNSDIVIVNTHLPPFPLTNVVMDLVMIFKVTSNNIERGRGGSEMY